MEILRGWKVVEKMNTSVSECAWQVAHHRNVRWQRRKIETKKMKKFFCVEVCAPEYARVGVQRKMADEHRERRNQVAKFVELANNRPVRVGGRHQGKIARQVVDAGSWGTQVDSGWQQNRALTY